MSRCFLSGERADSSKQRKTLLNLKVYTLAGLVSVRSSPTAPEQPYAFFLCNDTNLWLNTWNGTTSVWTNQGHPPADVAIVANGGLGAVVLQDTPTAQERPYVFVQGSDGYLWTNWWSA